MVLIVENGAARHTHDTYFVQIASRSTLVCGFGYALRIQAYGFGFGCLVCTFWKALRMEECAIVLGSCSIRKSLEKSGGESGSTEASVKELEAQRWESVCFSFS